MSSNSSVSSPSSFGTNKLYTPSLSHLDEHYKLREQSLHKDHVTVKEYAAEIKIIENRYIYKQ